MASELTIIVSVLVPLIAVQIVIMLLLFRRMDRMDARQTEERREMENRLIRDRQEMEQRLIRDRQEMEQRLVQRMDKTDEEANGLRTEMSSISNRLARIEGAVEVLRDLVERFVTVRQ